MGTRKWLCAVEYRAATPAARLRKTSPPSCVDPWGSFSTTTANEGQDLAKFDILEYSSQVVAGTMHLVTVDVGKADQLKLRVFECLPCNRNPGAPRFEIKGLELGAFTKDF